MHEATHILRFPYVLQVAHFDIFSFYCLRHYQSSVEEPIAIRLKQTHCAFIAYWQAGEEFFLVRFVIFVNISGLNHDSWLFHLVILSNALNCTLLVIDNFPGKLSRRMLGNDSQRAWLGDGVESLSSVTYTFVLINLISFPHLHAFTDLRQLLIRNTFAVINKIKSV